MGGHGHGHHEPYTVPDWKTYKIEDAPKLQKIQTALASQGLTDPWARNEVWRFNEKVWGTDGGRFRTLMFRGFRTGFAAFLITIAGTAVYDKMYPSEHDHHGH